MKKHKIALIMAGGVGIRMNVPVPKQFLEIWGKPVLMHTIMAFQNYDPHIEIILVLPASQINYWNELCKKYAFGLSHKIVEGGNTRFQSVKNGLALVTLPSLVAVHDAVRPLVSIETIERCYAEAEKSGTAIPVVDLVDSIREVSGNESKSADRSKFKLVQTPQVFDGALLLSAYRQEYSDLFTDDASVVENNGIKINLVEGNRENIKITTQIDLIFAEMMMKGNIQ